MTSKDSGSRRATGDRPAVGTVESRQAKGMAEDLLDSISGV